VYMLNLDEDATKAVEALKERLGADTTEQVLSLCLGFVYQLMELADENEQVMNFVSVLAEKFKSKYEIESPLN